MLLGLGVWGEVPNWIRLVFLVAVVFGLIGCDKVSKDVAKTHLEQADGVSLVGDALELRYTENRDVAFNAMSWVPESTRARLILVTGAVAICALGAMLLRRRQPLLSALSLSLILAGAVGNYWDRLERGYVVDFVHLTHWPVFNLADVYITLGGIALLLSSWRPAPLRT
ncbi:MAG: signal peptidase II [Polyangiaceae bacterium]